MRVLILGGAGMLGHRLTMAFRDEFETWTTVREPIHAYARYGIFDPERTIDRVDVLNLDNLGEALAKARPEVVINCVGIIKQLPGAEDRILGLTVNSLLPHRLHRFCKACGARLIHFSTDCVFSGRKGMYTESDPSDAVDFYGRTKFLGETAGSGALTIRTSIIGRELSTTSGLVEWFLSQRGRRVEGYRQAMYSGFTTHAMSRIVRSVLLEQPELCGTLQVSSFPINKYELLLLVRSAYGAEVEIVPSDRVTIDRSLDSGRFRALTGFVPPSWPEMVQELAADPTPYERWRAERSTQHV